MGRMMTILAVTLVAALTGCTGSNPIQKEMGHTANVQLANRTSQALEMELVAGTTPTELRGNDVVARITLAPGEAVKLPAYPGRYTLFPHQIENPNIRTLAFNGVKLESNLTQVVTVGEEEHDTVKGIARRMTFQAS